MKDRYTRILAEETGERFDVEECPICGLGRTRPEPVDMDAYYPATYHGNPHRLSLRFCLRRRLRLVRSRVGKGAGRKLLDFGCGDASFLLAAREEGWDCCGVDRNPPASIPDDLTVVRSLDELGDRPLFDCVTAWHVLEHLNDPVDVLTRLRALVKPGGVVLASVPNFGSWQARCTGSSWLHLDIPRHFYHFTKPSLTKTFEAAGFRVQDVSFGELEYDVIGWSQSLLNLGLSGRNEFYKVVKGRPVGNWSPHRAIQVPVGLVLSLLATIPAWAESLVGRAGTLIVTARSGQQTGG
jgi:2-polyprenyl-3-methyl-5-hydroxy-6-metoxy-1,4-benzoquinol methylase